MRLSERNDLLLIKFIQDSLKIGCKLILFLVDMAFFRNLEKVVPSSLFTKPNSLILLSKFRPVYLEKSSKPTIDHLHTLRPLLKTIEFLENHTNNPNYQRVVKSQLEFLTSQQITYLNMVNQFVTQGGLLTGEGIANVYFSAEKMNVSSEWLEKYVHSGIPHKYTTMSRQNLIDVVAGLEKYHKNSPYLTQVKEQLSKRPNENPTYVEHQHNQSNKYQYAAKNNSNHCLISTIINGQSIWKYYICQYWAKFARKGRYALHSD